MSCSVQGAQHSAQIFSLAMLLSSIFVYNQVGAIDAIAIERLAMVCELAKRIKDKSTAGAHSLQWPAAAARLHHTADGPAHTTQRASPCHAPASELPFRGGG